MRGRARRRRAAPAALRCRAVATVRHQYWYPCMSCRSGRVPCDAVSKSASRERREVLDVLAARSAHVTSHWLTGHSEIEIVNRDRAGLYADGARQGAPQALQVADRFHLLQNLRKSIEQQMSRAPRQHEPFVPDGGEPLLAAGAFHRRYEQPEVMKHRLLLAAGRRAADEGRVG